MRWRVVRSIAREELRDQVRDGRLRWALVAFVGLLVVAFAFGARRMLDVRTAHDAARAESYGQFQRQSPKNPHAGAHFGLNALRPVPLLSSFDRGADDHIGTDIFLEPHRPNLFSNVPALDTTGAARLGQTSGAEAALFLLPLLAIVLGAPALTKERERGTLRLYFAQNITGLEIATGKALGVMLVLGAALAIPLLVSTAALFALGRQAPASVDGTRVVLLLFAFGAHTLVFLLLSLAASALTTRTRTALLLSLGAWALLVLAAPRIVDQLVRARIPTPSAIAFQRSMAQDRDAHFDYLAPDGRKDEVTRALLAHHGVSRAEDLPVNLAGVLLEDAEVRGNRVFDRHYEQLFDRYREQQHLTGRLSLVSPVSAVALVSATAAGTDVEHRLDWWRSAETHRRRFNTILNDYFATHSTSKQSYGFVVSGEAWALVPPWEYTFPSGAWALQRAAGALVVLVGWIALAAAAFVIAARRMRPV